MSCEVWWGLYWDCITAQLLLLPSLHPLLAPHCRFQQWSSRNSHMVISISGSASQETTYNIRQVRRRKLGSTTHLPSIFNSFPLSFPSSFIHTYMHVTSNGWEPSMKQELDLTSFTKRCLGVFFLCIHSIWGSRHFLAWHLLSFLEISLSLSLCMLLLSLYLLPFWNPNYKYIRPSKHLPYISHIFFSMFSLSLLSLCV